MFCVKSIAASMMLALVATSASAATYTFDLQNLEAGGDTGTLSGNSLEIQNGDLTGTFEGRYLTDATFTGSTLTGGTSLDAHSVTRFYNGLGVCNDGPCYSSDPLHTVDGHTDGGALTDFVEMSFDIDGTAAEVTLVSVLFGWVGDFSEGRADGYSGTNGSYEILLDVAGTSGIDVGDFLGASGIATVNPSLPGYGTAMVDFLGLDLTADLFGIKAGLNGSWKLRSVVVDYSVPEIPLPAAGWLLLAGIGSIAAMRRRKS